MSPLSNYLQRKERAHTRELNKFIKESRKLVIDVSSAPVSLEREDGSVEVSQRNNLRREVNSKLKIYDCAINGATAAVRKCIDKVVMIYAMLRTVIFIAVVVSLTVSAIFGGIILLIKVLR
jgi:hypothetical protein